MLFITDTFKIYIYIYIPHSLYSPPLSHSLTHSLTTHYAHYRISIMAATTAVVAGVKATQPTDPTEPTKGTVGGVYQTSALLSATVGRGGTWVDSVGSEVLAMGLAMG
jgi:hypothetical protein